MNINKNKILNYVRANNTSIRSLEAQAGLAINAIHNIIHDKSKNPSIDKVLKIARAINCTVEELFNSDDNVTPQNAIKIEDQQISY